MSSLFPFFIEEGVIPCSRFQPPCRFGPCVLILVASRILYTCTSFGRLTLIDTTIPYAPTPETLLKSYTLFNLSTSDLWSMKLSPEANQVFTCGFEQDLTQWDLGTITTTSEDGTLTPRKVWAAKNVKNDWLDLRVPIFSTDMEVLSANKVLVVGSGYIRVYAPGKQRRPIMAINDREKKYRACTVVSHFEKETQIVVGDISGNLSLFSMPSGQELVKFHGSTGAVRFLDVVHDSNGETLVMAVGVDKFLRVWNLQGKEIVKKFLKQCLNGFVAYELQAESGAELAKGGAAEDAEDVWDELEEVHDEEPVAEPIVKSAKKRKSTGSSKLPKKKVKKVLKSEGE